MNYKLNRNSQLELKKKWIKQYKELEKILNHWDPLGLIEAGAPIDEYDCLGTQILSLLLKGKPKEELKSFILKELDKHFGLKVEDLEIDYRNSFSNSLDNFCNKVLFWYESLSEDNHT